MTDFSLIVLTRNAENIVENNLIKIYNYISNLDVLDRFEIIVSDYSEDSTFSILESMAKKFSNIHPVKSPRKGIGCGITTGVQHCSYEYVMFYPIDMAWDLSIIKNSLEKLEEGYDVILGSRGVYGSKTTRPLKRKIFSKGYNTFINILFNLKINDTQGTCAFKKLDYVKYCHNLENDGPFLQTEILIYSKINNLKILELPAIVTDLRKDSSINVLSFSINMLKEALKKKVHLTRT